VIAGQRLRFDTARATEFVDLTGRVQQLVQEHGLRHGRVTLQSLHTTLGLAVNENEPLLLADLEALLGRLVPEESTYLHDDFTRRSGAAADEPANGHAHARNLLLQPALTLLVEDGCLLLGRWQSLFAVELDGPRRREIAVQLDGEREAQAADGPRRLIQLELERQMHGDPAGVRDPMRRLIEAGGKRFRGLLVFQAGRLGPAYDPLREATLAAAIELIHAATLVHDDYVDESPLRRGRPTVAAAEGPARAVAVGDFYFANATRMIAELGNPDVTTTIAGALEAICRSQIDDVELRGGYPGDAGSYMQVVRGKTAALISAACVAAAQLAEAPAAAVDRLRRYGELLGVAFQLADDVVDFSEASGKPKGQDIRQRTLSLPLIYATEDARLGAEIRRLLAGPLADAELDRVIELVVSSGALDRVTHEAGELVEAALGALEGVDLDGARAGLTELARAAVGRTV
jgi:secondary thiamine-phosphate synthase enzyme